MKETLPISLQKPGNRYWPKLNGYRCVHRNRWLLLQHGELTLQAASLLDFYICVSDFDAQHTTYGTFAVYFDDVAHIFNCSSSTIRVWHKELLKKKFISPTYDKRVFTVPNPARYQVSGRWKGQASKYAKLEKDQPIETILQLTKVGIQPDEETFQPTETNASNNLTNHAPKALVSSKGESKDSLSNQFTDADKDWLNENY